MLPKCHRCCKRQMFLVPILSKTVCLLHRVSISQGSLCEVGMCFFPMECSQNALLWGLSLKCHIRALCLLFIHGAIFLTSLKSKAPWCIYFHCEEKLASYAWMTENVYWACPVHPDIWMYSSPLGLELCAVTKDFCQHCFKGLSAGLQWRADGYWHCSWQNL